MVIVLLLNYIMKTSGLVLKFLPPYLEGLCVHNGKQEVRMVPESFMAIVQVSEIDCMGLSSRIRCGSFILISGSCGLLKIERFSVASFF